MKGRRLAVRAVVLGGVCGAALLLAACGDAPRDAGTGEGRDGGETAAVAASVEDGPGGAAPAEEAAPEAPPVGGAEGSSPAVGDAEADEAAGGDGAGQAVPEPAGAESRPADGPGAATGADSGEAGGAVGGDDAAQPAAGRGESAAPPPDPAAPPEAGEIVRRAREAYDSLRTLRASFVQVLEMRVFEPPRRKEGRGTWYQKKPSLFRMDFSDPEGDLIVADGRHLWLYYPSTHPDQVIRSDLEAPGQGAAMVDLQGRIFRQARTVYRPRLEGREEVSGRSAHLLVLEPRTSGTPYREVRVWVDVESHLVRRLQFHDRSETVRTITLDDLRPDVPMADTLFRFEPPPGAEVFEG